MERLELKMASASKALAALKEVAGITEVPIITRDAAIQRFEFSFEAVWKAAQMYLKEIEGLEVGSPKGVLRTCMQIGILSDKETALGWRWLTTEILPLIPITKDWLSAYTSGWMSMRDFLSIGSKG